MEFFSISKFLISEFGSLPIIDEGKSKSVPTLIFNRQSRQTFDSLIPKTVKLTDLSNDLKKIIEFTELEKIDTLLAFHKTEKLDSKSILQTIHKVFVLVFFSCMFNSEIKNSHYLENLFKNDEEAILYFVLLKTSDVKSFFMTDNISKIQETVQHILSVEKFLLMKTINKNEESKEKFRIVKLHLEDDSHEIQSEALGENIVLLKTIIELVVASLDLQAKIVFMNKSANSSMKLKTLDISSIRHPNHTFSMISYQNESDFSLLINLHEDESGFKGTSQNLNQIQQTNALSYKKSENAHFGRILNNSNEMEKPTVTKERENQKQTGNLNPSENKNGTKNRSSTPKRVFQNNDGRVMEKNQFMKLNEEIENEDKTDRTHQKPKLFENGKIGLKIDSDSKHKDENNHKNQGIRSHSVNQKSDLRNPSQPSEFAKRLTGFPSNADSLPKLVKIDEKKKSLEGILRLSQQGRLDDTRNDSLEIKKQINDISRLEKQQERKNHQPSESRNITQIENQFSKLDRTPSKVENRISLSNESKTLKETKNNPFFLLYPNLNSQMSKLISASNENTKTIQSLYKLTTTTTGTALANRLFRDSMEIRQMTKPVTPPKEKLNEAMPDYLQMFEKISEPEAYKKNGNLTNMNNYQPSDVNFNKNGVRIAKPSNLSQQRQNTQGNIGEQKTPGIGLNFYRSNQQTNHTNEDGNFKLE